MPNLKDVLRNLTHPAEQNSIRVDANRDRVFANQRAEAAISVRRSLAKPRS